MKLVTLNIWGAIVKEPLIQFINDHLEIDIFCFQELYQGATIKLSENQKDGISPNIFSEIQELLPNHTGYFRPVVNGVYGIGAFVKKDIDVIAEGEILIHENIEETGKSGRHSRNMQWLEIKAGSKPYSILNVHGLWTGSGKNDTPARLEQSKRIKEFMDTIKLPKILCGDFNLLPDTKSVAILEEGMRNLVKDYKVETTRTSHYTKPEKFADYIFTSPEIKTNHFEVLPDEVSDHSPLLVEFE